MSLALFESAPLFREVAAFDLPGNFEAFTVEEAYAVGQHPGYRIAGVSPDFLTVFGGTCRSAPGRRAGLQLIQHAWMDEFVVNQLGGKEACRFHIGHLCTILADEGFFIPFDAHLAMLIECTTYQLDFLVTADHLASGFYLDLVQYPDPHRRAQDPNTYFATHKAC